MAPGLQARNGFTMTRLPWVAGIRGGFALVIGIDRGHNGEFDWPARIWLCTILLNSCPAT
jgi:hypothetical protein